MLIANLKHHHCACITLKQLAIEEKESQVASAASVLGCKLLDAALAYLDAEWLEASCWESVGKATCCETLEKRWPIRHLVCVRVHAAAAA